MFILNNIHAENIHTDNILIYLPYIHIIYIYIISYNIYIYIIIYLHIIYIYVKTPAVKPCIVYIIDLPDSVGSKELRAERLLVYFTPIAVDLVKYRLSAVVSLLCYGDPN